MRTLRAIGVALTIAVLLAQSAYTQEQAGAASSWLEPLVPWNSAGMSIPPGPPNNLSGNLFACAGNGRWPETAMDDAVRNAGWTLTGSYRGGWGLVVIAAASGYDGACRPVGTQGFIFARGQFAGTIAPNPLRSPDEAPALVFGPGVVLVRYLRYLPTDADCCPSGPALDVRFDLTQTDDGPVMVPNAAQP